MSDYYGMDSAFEAEKGSEISGSVSEKTEMSLSEKLWRMKRTREAAQHHLQKVVDSEKLAEFSEKFRKAGALGLAGMLPKIPEILPELAPIFPALKALVEVDALQFEIIEELSKKIEKLEVRHGG